MASFLSNKKVKRRGIAALLSLLLIRIACPYLLVVNSIPGQMALSDQERQILLDEPIQRVQQVCLEKQQGVLSIIAETDRDKYPLDNRDGIVPLTRIILANFLLNQNVNECNELLRKMTVWGNSGSSWLLNKGGDYDFAAIWMITILYEFGENPDTLYPQTKDYLLRVLLPDQGRLDRKVPRTLGLVFETENHLLMREGSRYLKNQWLKSHGNSLIRYDNDKNGLDQWLERYLNHMRLHGLYEYNSVPYLSYSILPLMNLVDYAESRNIRNLAETILDAIFDRFAYGSFDLKQCAPFRRQFKHAQSQSLELNRCRSLVRFWQDEKYSEADQIALAAVIHGYTLPVETCRLFDERNHLEYFKIFSHSQKGSPEIYSGGKHYLLSAGGAYRGKNAKVISRPIALLLDDDAKVINDCIHIKGHGDWKTWNMSGVHQRFAVAKGTVFVPGKYDFQVQSGWNILSPSDDITVSIYQSQKMAILVIIADCQYEPERMKQMLKKNNPFLEQENTFNWPQEIAPDSIKTITFDIYARASQWVITEINNKFPANIATRKFEQ